MTTVIVTIGHASDDFFKLVILQSVHPGQSSALRFLIQQANCQEI